MIHAHDIERRVLAMMEIREDPHGEPDEEDVLRVVREIAQEKNLCLPASYGFESAMWLAAPRRLDTTDRSLVVNYRAWEGAGRTRDETEEKLRRRIYYTTPFVTCENCNALIFIDAGNARTFHLPVELGEKKTKPDETLLACGFCGTTTELHLGAEDLASEISGSAKQVALMIKLRNRAATRLATSYRTYLRKIAARHRRQAAQIRGFLLFRCAAVRQAVVRGRLGRRKAVVQRCLVEIRNSNPVALSRALKKDGGLLKNEMVKTAKVFWYKSAEQVTLLFDDYLLLCSRMGFIPPRFIVEANIVELGRRIRIRTKRLVRSVQAMWRGITVRVLVTDFFLEVARNRSVRCAMAFRISRLCRGWVARLRAVQTHRQRRHDSKHRSEYAKEREEQKQQEKLKKRQAKLGALYLKSRAEERTARYCGLVHPSSGQGNKMLAFRESAYGDEEPMAAAHELARAVAQQEAIKARAARTVLDRAINLKARTANDRALQWYHERELGSGQRLAMDRIANQRRLVKDPRAFLKLHNSQPAKSRFQFPASVYADPRAALREGLPTIEVEQRRRQSKEATLDGGGAGGGATMLLEMEQILSRTASAGR